MTEHRPYAGAARGVKTPAGTGGQTSARNNQDILRKRTKSRIRTFRGMSVAGAGTALKELKTLPGIGDFSAGLILLRGAGDPDAVAYHEPRLALAVADAYGLPGPATTPQLTEISENWRPYRTWVTLLLRTQQEIPAAGELRWGQHVVAPRVPLAVRSCYDHNQDGRGWTKRRRDPGPAGPGNT